MDKELQEHNTFIDIDDMEASIDTVDKRSDKSESRSNADDDNVNNNQPNATGADNLDFVGRQAEHEADEDDAVEYKWHVVNVAKNSELSLRNALIGFSEAYKIKRIYIPMERIKRWKNQEQIQEMKPVMNYLFVLCPTGVLNDRFLKNQIKSRYSVVDTIPESEIHRMEKEFANIETIIDTSLSEGSRVYIIKGSFSGLNGQIQKIDGLYAEIKVWLMEDCEPTNIVVPLADLIRQSDYVKDY